MFFVAFDVALSYLLRKKNASSTTYKANHNDKKKETSK